MQILKVIAFLTHLNHKHTHTHNFFSLKTNWGMDIYTGHTNTHSFSHTSHNHTFLLSASPALTPALPPRLTHVSIPPTQHAMKDMEAEIFHTNSSLSWDATSDVQHSSSVTPRSNSWKRHWHYLHQCECYVHWSPTILGSELSAITMMRITGNLTTINSWGRQTNKNMHHQIHLYVAHINW